MLSVGGPNATAATACAPEEKETLVEMSAINPRAIGIITPTMLATPGSKPAQREAYWRQNALSMVVYHGTLPTARASGAMKNS
jgi:hypothetical protein